MVLEATGLEPPKGLSDSLVLHLLALHDLLSPMQGAVPSVRIHLREGDCVLWSQQRFKSSFYISSVTDELIAQCLSSYNQIQVFILGLFGELHDTVL